MLGGVVGAAVIGDNASRLDLFDGLTRVLLCLGRDVRIVHSSLVMATGKTVSLHEAEVDMDYAPCGLQRRGWVLNYCTRMTLCEGKDGEGMEVDGGIGRLKCDYLSYLSVGIHHYDLNSGALEWN